MIILSVDTSGPSAGAAVIKEREVLCEIFLNSGLTHSQTIMPAVEDALTRAGITPDQVDAFACVAGPGSFTGVRIGVCAVRGMAHAAGKPCIALDALEVLAHAVYGFPGIVCPILDARRDQVYAAAFRTGETPERVLADEALALSDLFEKLPKDHDILFTGEAAPLHREEISDRFGSKAKIAPAHSLHVRPAAAADLAMRFGSSRFIRPESLKPLYLRAPSAERERAAALAGKG